MMLIAIAVVIGGIGVYARADFGTPAGEREARAPFTFWLLLLAIWGSLNLVFVSGDLFTLYVALELLTFAAVPLVCLDGRGETLRAALRYLLFALLGSVLYLLGAVLLYGAYGTLDIPLLAARIRPEPVTWAAAALMTVGLLAKTALFPLHLWLPPAHAGAPAAASAVLSALVVKGSWFLVVRLWFDVMPGVVTLPSAQLLGGLGAAAILVGNVVALRQERLKLLIAYSTVAQIGYLFLMFPLAFDGGRAPRARRRADGRHAAGDLARHGEGRDVHGGRLDLRGVRPRSHRRTRAASPARCRVSVLTFGARRRRADGRAAERRLSREEAAARRRDGGGQWWWALVLQAGGVLTSSYVVLVLAHALAAGPAAAAREAGVARRAVGGAGAGDLFVPACLRGSRTAAGIADVEPAGAEGTRGDAAHRRCGGALAWALAARADGTAGADPVERWRWSWAARSNGATPCCAAGRWHVSRCSRWPSASAGRCSPDLTPPSVHGNGGSSAPGGAVAHSGPSRDLPKPMS